MDWRKCSTFVLTHYNNGEEHWNSAVCNSWTTDSAALQYSEYYLVTTINLGFSGSQSKMAKRWNHLIFSAFLFLPKSMNTEKYYGRLWVMCEWAQLWAISLTVDNSWLWVDKNTRCYHHIPAQNEGFSEWERTSDPVRVAISEFSKHTLTLENSLVELKL